jgi:hypothetical protein
MRVTRYPIIRERLAPALGGRLINELRDIAVVLKDLPTVTVCQDPHDNYLLAMAVAGAAVFARDWRQARPARSQTPRGHEDRHRARLPDLAQAVAMTEPPRRWSPRRASTTAASVRPASPPILEAGGTPEHGQETAVHDSSMALKVNSPLEF